MSRDGIFFAGLHPPVESWVIDTGRLHGPVGRSALTEHRLTRLPLICLLWVLAMTASSFGDLPLPASIYTSADPTPDKKVIADDVQKEEGRLAGSEYAAWGAARALIVGEATRQGITQGFLDVYADVVNEKLLPIVTSDKDARHRLNVAIIVAKVAAKANNAKLMPITEALLHDPSDAVVLWGLQSAKYIIPVLVQTGRVPDAKRLGLEVAVAAKAHVTPATVEEAYRALVLDPNFGTEKASDAVLKTLSAKAITDYLPAPIAFYQYRVKLYAVAAPEQPIADTWGSSFFIKSAVWSAATPQEQSQILQAMFGLIRGAFTQYSAGGKPPDMFDLIKRTGQAFDVVGNLTKTPQGGALQKTAHNISSVPADVGMDELDAKIKVLEDAVKNLGTAPAPAAP
jgi:hypothetical protein